MSDFLYNGKDILIEISKCKLRFDLFFRRVHISESTLLNLGDEYQVEEAFGHERDAYIAKLGIKTYFIIPREGTNIQNQPMMKYKMMLRFIYAFMNFVFLVLLIHVNRAKKCKNY